MDRQKILVIDDDDRVRDSVSRVLQQKGFDAQTADSAETGLEALTAFRPELVLTDIKMPGTDGVELAGQIKRVRPETAVIMMTGYASVDTAVESLKLGVDDYIKKPFHWNETLKAIQSALEKRARTIRNKQYVEELERKLLRAERKPEAGLLAAIRRAFSTGRGNSCSTSDVVEGLTTALSAHEPESKDHSITVGATVARMAEFLSFPREDVDRLECAALLHDVGKLGIPRAILDKLPQDLLTDEEIAQYKQHPLLSYRILQPVNTFQPILAAVLHHHERLDGGGFPDGLAGDDIPIGARMIAVADSFAHVDAAGAHEETLHEAFAMKHLTTERGSCFDAAMVKAFMDSHYRVQPVGV